MKSGNRKKTSYVNQNNSITFQNMKGTTKAVFREKFVALYFNGKKERGLKVNELLMRQTKCQKKNSLINSDKGRK